MLLGNAVSINQVMVSHLRGLEQLLVTFPRTIAGGFTGTHRRTATGTSTCSSTATSTRAPRATCRPTSGGRATTSTDGPIYPAAVQQRAAATPCAATSTRPDCPPTPNPARAAIGSYDPLTGLVTGAVDANGNPVRFVDPGNLSVLGGDSWKWLLVGPVS